MLWAALVIGVAGFVSVLVIAQKRFALAPIVLVAAFGLFAAGGAMGIANSPVADPQWCGPCLAAGVLALVGGVLAALGQSRTSIRTVQRAVAQSDAQRREIDRLSASNVRLEDESQALRGRLATSIRESSDGCARRDEIIARTQRSLDSVQAEERKHRMIVEGALEGMAMLESDSMRMTTVNPSLVRMTGYDATELAARSIVELFAPGSGRPGKTDLRRCASEGHPVCVEIQRKDGHTTWADVGLSFVGSGKDGQFFAVIRDVSAQIELERELQTNLAALRERERSLEDANRELAERTAHNERMNVRLRLLQEQKDHFVSMVSHELRTPLTSMRSFSEILLRHGETEPEVRREFLSIINKECERLTRLVNDVLDLARIEAGKVRLDLEETDVREAVLDAVRSMSGMAGERKVSLRCETGAAPRWVLGDKDKIQQVVMNLVGNAVKYSEDGGEVAVIVKDAVRVGGVEICVADQGPGIPSSEIERVFEKFFSRGDAAPGGVPGTGLGLAICRELSRLHGGRVWAESDGTKGTRFRVELPGLDEGRRMLGRIRRPRMPGEGTEEIHRRAANGPGDTREMTVPILSPEPPAGVPVLAPTNAGKDGDRWTDTGSLPPLAFPSAKRSQEPKTETRELPPMR